MKNTLFTYLLFYSCNCFSQVPTFTPFPTQAGQWNVRYLVGQAISIDTYFTDEYDLNYYTTIDTIINSKTYTQLYFSRHFIEYGINSGIPFNIDFGFTYNNYKGAYRSNVASKRIYFVAKDSSTENILYDFSVQPGQQINNWYNTYLQGSTILVDSIDSVLVNFQYRKRINFSTINGSGGKSSIIDGIGNELGLLNPLGFFEDNGYLDCFSINGSTVFPDSTVNCPIITSFSHIENRSILNISPNPANDFIAITYQSDVLNKDVLAQIFNINMQVVKIIDLKKITTQINISDLPIGIYFLNITSKNKFESKLFIKN